jgi:hypothetical protein
MFPGMPGPTSGPGTPPEKPSEGADARRTRRQHDVIGQGGHPLGLALALPLALHPQAKEQNRTCGNCAFRMMTWTGSNSRHPKCLIEKGPAATTGLTGCPYQRVSCGPGTDVRKWWPGCRDHEFGDNDLSPDAARSGPPEARDE